jgi:FtsP/CotA-like multicopper oxidase with cupredoxin domain
LILEQNMKRRKFLSLATSSAAGVLCRAAFAKRGLGGAFAGENIQSADFTLHIAPVSVELAPGKVIKTTGYNGTAPGPLIRLKEGVAVTIDVYNDTVHPNLVHWHGLAIDSRDDGAMEEGSPMIPPQGRIRYAFTPGPSGSRWYHAHTSAKVDSRTVDLGRASYTGQFGFLYVEPKQNAGAYDQEVFLAIHHWEPSIMEMNVASSGCQVKYKVASFNDKVFSAAEPLRVRQGQRVLFHFVNASATQNVLLALPQHQFMVVALDGNPVPNPRAVSTVSLAVAERVDAIVEMNEPGVWILGSKNDAERASGLGLTIEYAGCAGPAAWTVSDENDWGYTKFGRSAVAVTPDSTFPMVFEKIAGTGGVLDQWTINGKSYPEISPLQIEKGKRYRLSFLNQSNEAHPVHLHRHSFEIVKIGSRGTSGIMKDVINVDSYQRIEVDFVADNPGPTLFHCHHQLHMDYGFMQLIKYV